MHYFKKLRASIAIFLILILAPMYTCAYLAVDTVRYSAAKVECKEAAQLSGNSALADYDKTFKELYGLFVNSQNEEDLTRNLSEYFSSVVDKSEVIYESAINTKLKEFKASPNEDLSITNTEVFDKYICEYMKYRAPYSWARGLSQKVAIFENLGKLKKDAESKKDYYENLEADTKVSTSVSIEKAKQQKEVLDTISSTDSDSYAASVETKFVSEMLGDDELISSGESSFTFSINSFTNLENAVENCFEIEYFSSMFTSLVDEEDDSRPISQGEFEYIIFGKDNIKTDVALSLDLILAIRILMNTVYVYTNTSMRESALAVATAIAGWSGIGIPLAQNALLLSWATAESILDLSSLCKGDSVPLYKTASTWTLGLGGLSNAILDDVTEYTCKSVDDVFEVIENTADDKIDDVIDSSLSYIENLGESTKDSLIGAVSLPVEKAINSLLSGEKTEYTRTEIEEIIVKAVDSIDDSSTGAKTAKQLFLKYCLSSLVDTIYENLPIVLTGESSIASEASAKITDAVNSAYDVLYEKLTSYVDKYVDNAKRRIDTTLNSASKEIKEDLVYELESYAKDIAEFAGEDESGTIASSGLGMTYTDYLKIFALFELPFQKDEMLKRALEIMQINCASKSGDFDITKCHFGIVIDADVVVGLHTIHQKELYSY